MKQRITYIVRDADSFTPDLLDVNQDSLNLKGVKAAKERKVTVGLSELPVELSKSFEQFHELHLRWATSKPYTSTPPFTSRISPGLHVLFTPHKAQDTSSSTDPKLCDLIHSTFGPDLKCASTAEASTRIPVLSERFSMSATSQYYSYVPTLSNFVNYIQDSVCKGQKMCIDAADDLLQADYLDIDYDTISHAVVVNAYWSTATDEKKGWTETIIPPTKDSAVEVGVLMHEKVADEEDIGFGGFLTVLGSDNKPSTISLPTTTSIPKLTPWSEPTRFQTPTRHYPLPPSSKLTYTTTFSYPTGLHPILHLSFPTLPTPPHPSCKLHTHLTLPSAIFVDKHQFSDPLFLSSHNLKALRSLSGATDLEAPDWVIPQWGSAALFQLSTPKASDSDTLEKGGSFNATIPLHLRYLPTSPDSGHSSLAIPWPVVFWACRAEEGTKMSVNPFDRVGLGYEGLFGARTRFMHVEPAKSGATAAGASKANVAKEVQLVEYIQVPVLDLRQTRWVEVGTIGSVVVAFLGLCWLLFGGKKDEEKKKKKKEKKKQ